MVWKDQFPSLSHLLSFHFGSSRSRLRHFESHPRSYPDPILVIDLLVCCRYLGHCGIWWLVGFTFSRFPFIFHIHCVSHIPPTPVPCIVYQTGQLCVKHSQVFFSWRQWCSQNPPLDIFLDLSCDPNPQVRPVSQAVIPVISEYSLYFLS